MHQQPETRGGVDLTDLYLYYCDYCGAVYSDIWDVVESMAEERPDEEWRQERGPVMRGDLILASVRFEPEPSGEIDHYDLLHICGGEIRRGVQVA